MADLLAAQVQRESRVTKGTINKENRVWKRWIEYTKCINFKHDIWLTFVTPESRTAIFGALAAALRQRQFSKPDPTELASSTVQEAVSKLGEIFRINVGYNPTHVPGSEQVHPALSRQFRGMKNSDPGEVQQKALPVCVYWEMHKFAAASSSSSSDLDLTVANILTLAYFFCMRSCEYLDVQGERRTKILCMRNIRFFDDKNRDITREYNKIHLEASVTLTFEFQKRDIRNDIISNDSTEGGKMCPVLAAAAIVKRIRSYNISSIPFEDIQINYVKSGGGFFTIPSSVFLQRIRFIVDLLGESRLSFTSSEVGTHSNRSGGAMGMFLAGTPIYTIMLMGRWSSNAFMRYIRKQVLQLSHGISHCMLTYNEFYTVPEFIHSHADGGLHCRGGVTLASSANLHGSHANMSRGGTHPAFHLNH